MKPLRSAVVHAPQFKWFAIAAIFIVGLIVYQPSLSLGFWTDDYWYVEVAGRMSLPDYLRAYFDPLAQWRWYRPMQGVAWWLGYLFFRGEPVGYHFVQTLLHAASAVLLFLLSVRITRKPLVGLLAAFVYLTFPSDELAVFWPAVVDPLLAPLFLLALWLWIDFLEKSTAWRYVLAFFAFVAALLTKEIAVFLPLVLFLVDRWLVCEPATFFSLVRRYALFLIALVSYALLELHAVTQGIFTTQLGYGPGLHVVSALMFQLATLAFPWYAPADASPLGLLAFLVIGIYFALKREFRVLFLLAAIVLTLLPILPFQPNLARNGRYLYLPLMGSAVAYALIGDRILSVVRRVGRGVPTTVLLGGIIPFLVWNGATISRDAESFGNAVRDERLQFRPIFQKHQTFPSGTFLYFIDPSDLYAPNIMFWRYGAAVHSSSTLSGRVAGLRDRHSAMVFYQDDESNWREHAVSTSTNARSAPQPPIRFDDAIRLDGFELLNDRVKQGDAVIALVYWRVDKKPERDYNVFAHLVDGDGKMIAGADKPAGNRNQPASSWRPGDLVPDGVIVPVPADAPVGKDLRLEIGLYDLNTLERLPIVDADGKFITDKLVIETIQISQ